MGRVQNERGDTLIEVLLAITIFTAAVIGAFIVMSNGIGTAQRSLEVTQVRLQVDNQVELLRHINNIALVSTGRTYANINAGSLSLSGSDSLIGSWEAIKKRAGNAAPAYEKMSQHGCKPAAIIKDSQLAGIAKPFFIDPATGSVVDFATNDTGGAFVTAAPSDPLYPGGAPYETAQEPPTFSRIIQSAHGSNHRPISQMIWVYAIKSKMSATDALKGRHGDITRYYDLHVRACWHSPVGDGVQTLGTIVRLYEPVI